MTTISGHNVYVSRESGEFQVQVNYSIPGYYDPESGEYFGDTSWTVTAGGFGTGGYESSESASPIIYLGLSSGPLSTYSFVFDAQNTFSADSYHFEMTVHEAGYSLDPVTVTGGAGIDLVVTGSGADTVDGGGGDDYLDLGNGADTAFGGDGNDYIDGGFGSDTMHGGAGDDLYIVGNALDQVIEEEDEGIDMVHSTVSFTLAANVENLILLGNVAFGVGNEGRNYIQGNVADNVLRGNGGDDQLYGGDGADTLDGGMGSDNLDGGAGLDRLIGRAGDDYYVVDDLGDRVIERADEGSDTVRIRTLAPYTLGANIENAWVERNEGGSATGNRLANAMTGSVGGDMLAGAAGDDTLDGAGGDDLLVGGLGADALVGGGGIDTASYAGSAAVLVDLQNGVTRGGHARGDTFDGIENLAGSDFADTLLGDGAGNLIDGLMGDDRLLGRAGDDVIRGGAGADRMDGGTGRDLLDYRGASAGVAVDLLLGTASGGEAEGDTFAGFEDVAGTAGADELNGDNRANLLLGGDGNDLIRGRGGDDVIVGGANGDRLHGGAGIDTLSYEGSTTGVTIDLLAGAALGGDATHDRFSGFENVRGGAGDDTLSGDNGANHLSGGAGIDTLNGGPGDDVIEGGLGSDTLDGGDGIDTLSYANAGSGVYVHLGYGWNSGADAMGDTYANFENIRGGAFGDNLSGNESANAIDGGAGIDFLDGSGGNDTLTGGAGLDTFGFMFGTGHDVVTDFTVANEQLYWVISEDYDTAGELLAVATTVDGNTVFQLDANTSVTLIGVTSDQLTFANFAFPETEWDM